MTTIHRAFELGQSIWFDSIGASLIASGELARLMDQGVRGVTSNPAIFRGAIADTADYDGRIERLVAAGASDVEVLDELERGDVAAAADLFRPLWEGSDGTDGFVSLEVSPRLADDEEGTVRDGLRLWKALDRPNVMIKVPATDAGARAVERLTAEGVNVNATLIFSGRRYRAVAEAYLRGLEDRAAKRLPLNGTAGVASVFVSRLDNTLARPLADAQLDDLAGFVAVDNARLVYQDFLRLFSGGRWERLMAKGARVQRPLWASTSMKDPSRPACLYVEELIGPETVNTVPPATLARFLAEGRVERRVDVDVPAARERMGRLAASGIDLEPIMEKLLADGLAAFVDAADQLEAAVASKRAALTR